MDSYQQRLDDISRQLEQLRATEALTMASLNSATGEKIKALELETQAIKLKAREEKSLPNRDADTIPYLPCQVGFIQDDEILRHLMRPRSKGGHGLSAQGAENYYQAIKTDPWAMVALARSVRGIGH